MAKQYILYIGVGLNFFACSPAMISVKQEEKKLSLEEIENPHNLTMRQRNDSDYSAIQRTAGLYRIGEVKINLAKFKLLDPGFNVSSLSFSDSLIYSAVVWVRGSSSSEDYQEDTVLMAGENIEKWEGLKNVEANLDYWKVKSETKGFGNDCPLVYVLIIL